MSFRSLPSLSNGQLETLLAALDPRLEGFGSGGSELDDAAAYIARLGLAGDDGQGRESPLITWLSTWSATGANRESLALAVATLIADRQASRHAQALQLHWGGEGQSLQDQLPVLLATVERRLLLVFGPTSEADALLPLRDAIQVRRHQVPSLQLLLVAGRGPASPATEAAPSALDGGLRLVVCDDLVRWAPSKGPGALVGLEPDLHLRSEGQAEEVWMQVQRLLDQGWLQPLDLRGASETITPPGSTRAG
ncbi:MAG: hypothetical protein ACKOCM_06745 [Cyanobacteriota bacterium]